ncbi:hypothetical protein OG239_43040 (plasmid) [Streptomyces sp. NBC_00868]|uniref:hypothetical protein n=1 Tax=Streptomyces sp. NBC_00868 TaxID=2903683 RepID=UPI002F90B128|nr:hypothetical protein OG239_43040 [Streptomyces sp. NBC_00868]
MANNYRERNGHQIELRAGETCNELLIDGTPLDYGQGVDGRYFLHKYAYVYSDNLMELAEQFVDHEIRADEIRARSKRRNGEDE